ncbi:MAG TPA: hypothetical protein DDZ51_14780 [Planctomycetaceae bacterium]|nr:hypothetical protein [Planctomycetaceae bacterium]
MAPEKQTRDAQVELPLPGQVAMKSSPALPSANSSPKPSVVGPWTSSIRSRNGSLVRPLAHRKSHFGDAASATLIDNGVGKLDLTGVVAVGDVNERAISIKRDLSKNWPGNEPVRQPGSIAIWIGVVGTDVTKQRFALHNGEPINRGNGSLIGGVGRPVEYWKNPLPSNISDRRNPGAMPSSGRQVPVENT